MNNLKKIKIWKKSMELGIEVHKATKGFPKEEKYGLVSQINRSAVSISSNIAEGAGRNSLGEFINFLGIANGSSFELQSQLIMAKELEYISESLADRLLEDFNQIQKMNYTFQNSLKERIVERKKKGG